MNERKTVVSLEIGDVIARTETGVKYRILHILEGFIVLCKMDVSKLDITVHSLSEVMEEFATGKMCRIEEDLFIYEDKPLSEKQRQEINLRISFVLKLKETYGYDYMELMGRRSKPMISEWIMKTGWSPAKIWRIIRTFLQSGENIDSIKDMRLYRAHTGYGAKNYTVKTGRPYEENIQIGIPVDEKVKEAFAAAIEYYKNGRAVSLVKAYDWMNSKFYSTVETSDGRVSWRLFPASERPTLRQFYYFANRMLSKKEREIAKTSAMEYRNNSRLLLSDTIRGSHGPGDRVQMDEVEVDLFLRSSLVEDKVIGRPIVYCMVDCYTRAIIAVSISLDNNSVLGMTNCFLNLMEDKVDYCRKYGLTITPEMWPSCIIPRRILVDRGSEYMSAEAVRIFRELGITQEPVSAGTGSLKGVVEQWFHQMHSQLNPHTENIGLIEKRHDSGHKKEAALTIDLFIKMLLQFVAYHNMSQLSDYPLEPDMIRKKIKPIPAELWRYGIEKYGSCRKPANIDQYVYHLLLPLNGTVSRYGLNVNGLNYFCSEDEELCSDMEQAGKHRKKFPVRIDPRDVGTVYYVRGGKMNAAGLNSLKAGNAGFAGLSLAEWETVRKYLSRVKRDGLITNEQHKAYINDVCDLIIQSAPKLGLPDASNMREIRNFEKTVAGLKYSTYFRIKDFLKDKLSEEFDDEDIIESEDLYRLCDSSLKPTDPADAADSDDDVSVSVDEEESHGFEDMTEEELYKFFQ